MVSKERVLAEIRRLTTENGGKPPGWRLFERETGIKDTDWYPELWLRWGDAVEEAGFARNAFTERFSDEHLAEHYAKLAQRLKRLPLQGEMMREARRNTEFPHETVFRRRFGRKDSIIKAVETFCRSHAGFEDVLAWCEASASPKLANGTSARERLVTGFVYLMKSGRHYKIGRTNAVGRREWELGIKIPVPPQTIHQIETDDPVGVEAYWHKRFDAKRGEGEWFELTGDDVAAFKRWKRIV